VKHFTLRTKEPFLFLQRLFFAAIVNVKITGAASAGDISLPIVIGLGGALFLSPPLLTLAFLLFIEDLKTYTIEGDAVKYVDDVVPISQLLRFDPKTCLPLQRKTK